jgi:hypothetical protein
MGRGEVAAAVFQPLARWARRGERLGAAGPRRGGGGKAGWAALASWATCEGQGELGLKGRKGGKRERKKEKRFFPF